MKKILLVEDTQTIAKIIQIYLTGWNLQFRDAKNGHEALATARVWRPDLILSDVRMPGMDGFELCASIRSEQALKSVPLVLITSLQDPVSQHKGKLVGATAFLRKPVGLDQLRTLVSELLQLKPVAASPAKLP